MADKEFLIRCACGSELMGISYWEWEDDEDFFIEFFRYSGPGLTLKQRAENAWRVLRGRSPKHWDECVAFDRPKVTQLRDELTRILGD